MRSDGDVIGFGHRRDLAHLKEPTGVAEVGLDDVDEALLQYRLELPAGVEPLTERNWRRDEPRDFAEPLQVLREEWLLDEQQAHRLQCLCQLLGERPVN